MKITKEHYSYILECMTTKLADTSEQDKNGYLENIKNDPRVKDPDKRIRWDLFNASVPIRFTCDTLYEYLDDTHIDSAIKQISKKLGWVIS